MWIYGLIDPRDDELRYIGKANDVDSRLKDHIKAAKANKSRKIARWIRGLLSKDLVPNLILLAPTSEADWRNDEREWIQAMRLAGFNLLNMTDGGDGVSGEAAREAGKRLRAWYDGLNDDEKRIYHQKCAAAIYESRVANGTWNLTGEDGAKALRSWWKENREEALEICRANGRANGAANARKTNAKKKAEGYFDLPETRARLKRASEEGNKRRVRIRRVVVCECGKEFPGGGSAYSRHVKNHRPVAYRTETRINGQLVDVVHSTPEEPQEGYLWPA